MAVHVIMLGPPGAGKGTQAKRVVHDLEMPHISTGDLFRAMKHEKTDLAKHIQDLLAEGKLVPDDITIKVLDERLEGMDCEAGAILDGYPRTIRQAEALDHILEPKGCAVDLVLYFDISEEEAVRRISGRRSCPNDGRIYHVEFNPPNVAGVCDDCGSDLTQRDDDKPDVVRDRYRRYLEKTQPLVDYYRKKGLLIEIDSTRPVDEITPDVIGSIQRAHQTHQH